MSAQLTRYDAARAALSAALRVDEVKLILNKAEQMKLYAKQSKDKMMMADAAALKDRATRRLGEIIEAQRKTVGLAKAGRPAKIGLSKNPNITLSEIGVDKNLAHQARKFAAMPEDKFEALVGRRAEAAVAAMAGDKAMIKAIRVEQQAEKKEARANREQTLGAKQAALPDKKYGVIYGDPPWRFEPWSRETGMDRAADNHYPTLALPEMLANSLSCKEPMPIAADDCVLFLWATVPMLPQSIQLMTYWGFEYRSHVIWEKDRIGTGYWFRNKHELLLVGVRGNIPAPAMGTQWPSLIEAPVGKHSAKPECFLEMIDAYFPTLPKIELFCRGPARRTWDSWGNEAEAAA